MLVEVPPLPTHATARILVSNGDKGAFLEIDENARISHVPEVSDCHSLSLSITT